MSIGAVDSLNVCADFGEGTNIYCSVIDGIPPYNYLWGPGSFPNNDTVYVAPGILQPYLNNFQVYVMDQCAKSVTSPVVRVYNQCPLVVPNIMTANQDNINDFLVIKNWEDYEQVSLQIFNRWGNLIYENDNYQNDWNGNDLNGKAVEEGVYFYMVTPKSEKYEYDNKERTLYTLHGFVHIVKN